MGLACTSVRDAWRTQRYVPLPKIAQGTRENKESINKINNNNQVKRVSGIFDGITLDTVREAATRAFIGHGRDHEVIRFKERMDAECRYMYDRLKNGTYIQVIKYRQLEKTNNNGKHRKIDSPDLCTRIYQVLLLVLLEPVYNAKDNLNGLNCKKGCGITAKEKKRSVLHRTKHLFYDRTDLRYALVIDQRECYMHVTVRAFRRALRMLVDDHLLVDFAVNLVFVNGRLPIGTPTSPIAHHIVMLAFDYYVKSLSPFSVRYADDNLLAFHTKEEAQAAKWRIKNYWWYELGMRAKRHTVRVVPLDSQLDFCGYKIQRNHRGRTMHNKGVTRIRTSTAERAGQCRTDESWAAYFGQMKHADAFNLMKQIEERMKLGNLTEKIRIDRKMDARNIDIRDLAGIVFTIHDYEIRYNSQKDPNWIKCLIGMEECDNGESTGRHVAREFHGNYQGLMLFLLACEKEYGKKNMLPLEDVELENQCGYIFKGSTNQMEYI